MRVDQFEGANEENFREHKTEREGEKKGKMRV